MNNKLHNELRKEFQLERMVLFSDAVFAIAITLLVIEIKVPEKAELEDGISNQSLLLALAHQIPKVIGFIISFMLIGIYWTVHHRMFGYVTSYTPKLLRLNLLFLFFIFFLLLFSTG
jgi:uncharacterized membrane protein